MDLTRGKIFKTLFLYSLPLIVTNVVQLLFHAADVMVLGIMEYDLAVAAVGACGSIINLMVALFTGFSTGANILVARCIGASDERGTKRAIGTSLIIGLLSGIILMVVALIGARQFLIWTNCQDNVLDLATKYMQIYFIGMPISMLYNFVASILRANGDSVRPMTYMLVSGALNVGLNIVFVCALRLTVEGVAIATVASNLLSLILALIALLKSKGICKIEPGELKIRKRELTEIVKIGAPASFCGIFFYIANVIMASAANAMGTDVMTANAISNQYDAIIYNVGCSVAIACTSMVGQNLGAGLISRIKKAVTVAIVYVTLLSLTLGTVFVIFAEPMLYIMTSSPDIVAIAKGKMIFLCLTYFITSIMEVLSSTIRALGRVKTTMVVGFICGLLIRCLWTYLVFPLNKNLGFLFVAYSVSAFVASLIYMVVYFITIKKLEAATEMTLEIDEP